MVVAARTFESESEKSRPEGVHAIGHVLDAKFLWHASPLDLLGMQSIKAGGEDLVLGGIGKQVPGDLLGDEQVIGEVLAKSLDDPVAPRPDVAVAVLLVAVGVGIAGDVEPLGGHSLGVCIAIQQAVDCLLTCLWVLVC